MHVCCPVLVVVRDSNFAMAARKYIHRYRGNKKVAGANFISASNNDAWSIDKTQNTSTLAMADIEPLHTRFS